MTREELETTFRQNKWLIAKRTGSAGLKSVTLGSEKLQDLIDEIAESFRLSEADRRHLRPTIGIDLHDGASSLAQKARNAEKVVKGAAIINDARKAGKLVETGKQFITGGMSAAEAASKAGQAAGKTSKAVKAAGKVAEVGRLGTLGTKLKWLAPITSKIATPLMIAQGVYAVGSASFFGLKARRYNLDCYELFKARMEATQPQSDAPRPGPNRRAASSNGNNVDSASVDGSA